VHVLAVYIDKEDRTQHSFAVGLHESRYTFKNAVQGSPEQNHLKSIEDALGGQMFHWQWCQSRLAFVARDFGIRH
jgi:hypothetical protein